MFILELPLICDYFIIVILFLFFDYVPPRIDSDHSFPSLLSRAYDVEKVLHDDDDDDAELHVIGCRLSY